MDLRLLKFMIVGGLGTLVNEGVFILTARDMPIFFSLGLAIELSIIFNFILNDIWTFKDRRVGSFIKRLLKFHVSSFSGGIVQYITVILLLVAFLHFSNVSEILLFLFFSYIKAQSLFLAVINFIGIVSGFAVRFITSLKYVWA
ncbi:GtrA family protein [Acidianus hospitalis]|uniref:GtrA family protein n=2 Tax=Acidianus hospitalis TaxID=563177 RepID=A0A2T9X487_9CREN|nr:GtrA family protein [Acidianus hospitalis]MDT7901270.1 GtrA family protein [Acidianus sp.]PVU74908.1 GtrA family protein [Acidianus hospitalis]